MNSVDLEHVTKNYGGATPSVDDVSLTVGDGEFFTLLGPSGCGKSTTLRMIAGFINPTSGRIRFGEREITNLPPHKRDTGMVFQNYALFPHMDVTGNVAYGLSMRRVAKADKRTRVSEALEIVGLQGYADRRIDQLSGGQQQRVALARALVIQPSVLLLDEPLSNLDAKLREETRAQIRQIQKRAGTTSVYVTHDQSEAMAMSDRIAVMESGVLHQVGTPREIYRRPTTSFVARFIGRSNVLPGTVDDVEDARIAVRLDGGDVMHAPIAEGALSGQVAAGDQIALSLRPETMRIEPVPTGSGTEVDALRATVRMTEFTGSSCVVWLRYGDEDLLATIADTDDLPHDGDEVLLRPDTGRAWVVAP
ncbi:spermidine/putrescine ABC transporter ATP-binding protein [Brachybacterium vulturis]|uniref:Spermidine/putrescine ABC transporter ATP-binding protein n=1 Tax=Brachybacterium vulturis TaxID=2017484 RepID=A0A291GIS3_9MICO|nr:ABC transporter ATP-binding protein [Brachybacterium vulturis]ATG50087.1 spermidine/putrescine ABC transporter ATP-binding protein [Brachybacterium vulturis]